MKILLIAEHDNKQLKSVNYHTYSAALQLQSELDILVIGSDCESVIEETKYFPELKNIIVVNAPDYAHQLPENTAPLMAEISKEYDYVMTGATSFGKNILPRVAALLNVGMLSDIVKIISEDTFVRPIYAGNALATVQTQESIKLMTIRSTAFPAVQLNKEPTSIHIKEINNVIPNTLSEFVSEKLTTTSRPELTSAKVIVSGGRGLKSAENFKLIEKLADQLGAAVGATRAAVDAGFVPNDYQVGQTGKVVAPDLYIAIGISGAIQHLAGMKDSKVIVAINSDPDAPIFQIADYGVVADLFEATKELIEELK
ncbi:MAG: FAD-binding protein [Gammaproteobacteria bacterium]|nr:FAD-binding protein [Gammaproteobacteria bacterium]